MSAGDNLRTAFVASHGHVVLLDPADAPGVEQYLLAQGLAARSELPARVERAGAGNMNLALRVTLGGRSLILKQGRPWVEKYDHIPAPWERTLVEGAFYRLVRDHHRVSDLMPALLALDPANHILSIDDLGAGGDCSKAYTDWSLSLEDVDALLGYLAALAEVPVPPEGRDLFANRAMRALNHEHIFRFPLVAQNGLDLDAITPGLSPAAAALKDDRPYCSRVAALGDVYLADGRCLVHGDFFPGSWFRTAAGIRVLDPEFCFAGAREFDFGVMLGHLALARTERRLADRVAAACAEAGLDAGLAVRFAGVEIMRRLIGVAQLPLPYGLDEKRMLLDRSRSFVMTSEGNLTCWV
jgi:5-methylthioribose kinase